MTRTTINNNAPHLKSPKNQNRRAAFGQPAIKLLGVFKTIQDDFQHDYARMTDEADSFVVLAELQVALFNECNNQRLSSWGRQFFCSPDPVTDLC